MRKFILRPPSSVLRPSKEGPPRSNKPPGGTMSDGIRTDWVPRTTAAIQVYTKKGPEARTPGPTTRVTSVLRPLAVNLGPVPASQRPVSPDSCKHEPGQSLPLHRLL
jgi:hypothetical protein